MSASIRSASRGLRSGNYTPLTCADAVSEGESHLTHMIPVALSTEFALDAGGG
jgi:hypothetical protein